MSARTTKANSAKTQEVILVDATGNVFGTSGSPLQTSTSALQTTPDLLPTKIGPITAITAATDIIPAVAATKVRAYRIRMNVGGANVITIFDGATQLERLNFAAAADKVLDFATRPWYTSTTAATLRYSTSTAAEFNAIFETTQLA